MIGHGRSQRSACHKPGGKRAADYTPYETTKLIPVRGAFGREHAGTHDSIAGSVDAPLFEPPMANDVTVTVSMSVKPNKLNGMVRSRRETVAPLR